MSTSDQDPKTRGWVEAEAALLSLVDQDVVVGLATSKWHGDGDGPDLAEMTMLVGTLQPPRAVADNAFASFWPVLPAGLERGDRPGPSGFKMWRDRVSAVADWPGRTVAIWMGDMLVIVDRVAASRGAIATNAGATGPDARLGAVR